MNAYHLWIAVLAGATALFAAVPAEACAIALRPDEKLKFAYEQRIFSAVAAVTITDARYTHPPRGDRHPWSATATIDTMLKGAYAPKTVTFRRGGGSAACDNDIADDNVLPRPGQRWITYFWTDTQRGQLVWIAYPVDVAAAADPVLGRRIKRRIGSPGAR